MLVKNNAARMIGCTLRETARHNWIDCYPVVDGTRIVGVVSSLDDGMGPDVLAGVGTRGAEYNEEQQVWLVSPAASAARALRAIPSEKREQASRDNGAKGNPESHKRGGRPRKERG
jgi:hypothetical protein